MNITVDRQQIKRVRERMRRRGMRLVLVQGVAGFWWVNSISHRREFGPYDDVEEACEMAERQGLDRTGLGGGQA